LVDPGREFFAADRYFGWGVDPQANSATANVDNPNDNVVADYDLLILFASKN